jgi:hypothetical protein
MIRETTNEREEFFYTPNLKAAVALVTLGFRLKEGNAVTRTVRADGKESTVFWFDCLNDKGQQADEIYRGMTKGGEALEQSDPENIVNYLRAYAANRDALVDIIRNTPRRIIIERNGKHIAIREDATEADKKEIAKQI